MSQSSPSLNIKEIKLLTNNPRKVSKLENVGIRVTRIPLEIRSTFESEPYLKTKASKMGHVMGLDELVQFYKSFGFKVLGSYPEHRNALLWRGP